MTSISPLKVMATIASWLPTMVVFFTIIPVAMCNADNTITCWNNAITHQSSLLAICIITIHKMAHYWCWDVTLAMIPHQHCSSQLIHLYNWHNRTTCQQLTKPFQIREFNLAAVPHQHCPLHPICFNNCTAGQLRILCSTRWHERHCPFGDMSSTCGLHTWIKGTPFQMLLQLWIIIHCNYNSDSQMWRLVSTSDNIVPHDESYSHHN